VSNTGGISDRARTRCELEGTYRPSWLGAGSYWNIPPHSRLQPDTPDILQHKTDTLFNSNNNRWGTSSDHLMADRRERRQDSPESKCQDACEVSSHTPRPRNHSRHSPLLGFHRPPPLEESMTIIAISYYPQRPPCQNARRQARAANPLSPWTGYPFPQSIWVALRSRIVRNKANDWRIYPV